MHNQKMQSNHLLRTDEALNGFFLKSNVRLEKYLLPIFSLPGPKSAAFNNVYISEILTTEEFLQGN